MITVLSRPHTGGSTRGWRMRAPLKRGSYCEQALAVLRRGGEWLAREIAAVLRIGVVSVGVALGYLRRRGLAVRRGVTVGARWRVKEASDV